MANGNGDNTVKTMFAWISIWITVGGVLFAAGSNWTRISWHMENSLLHETPKAKQERIDRTVEDKLEPLRGDIQHMRETLERIERKLEELN